MLHHPLILRYMATSGLDTQLKIWDIRTYKQLQAYRTVRPASTLDISQRGLLAAGCGPHVQVNQYINNFLPNLILLLLSGVYKIECSHHIVDCCSSRC